MGRLKARLYCCSGETIRDMNTVQVTIAYDVLGAYAALASAADDDLVMIEPEEFMIALLRTAFFPVTARHPDLGGAFLDCVPSGTGQRLIKGDAGFPGVFDAVPGLKPHIRSIPGLLVYPDQLKRRNFLGGWNAAMPQP